MGSHIARLHPTSMMVGEARDAVTDLLDRGASMIKIALAPGDPSDPWPVLIRVLSSSMSLRQSL